MCQEGAQDIDGGNTEYWMFSGVGLELHQPTVERMKENYSKRGVELNDARLRMAMLPQTSQVLTGAGCCPGTVQFLFLQPSAAQLFCSFFFKFHQLTGLTFSCVDGALV